MPTNRIASILVTAFALSLFAGVAFAGSSPESVVGAMTISTAQAKSKHNEGVAFIDVRGAKHFNRRHIPGAKNLSIKKGAFTKEALAKIAPPKSPIAIYCKGVDCALSSRAAKEAVSWGYSKVFYFREGIYGWVGANHATE